MGEKDLYDYWEDTYKVKYGVEAWSQEVAADILSEWQSKFSQEVASLVHDAQMSRKYRIDAYSSSYLNDILAQFSEVSLIKLSIGIILLVRAAACSRTLRSRYQYTLMYSLHYS